MTGISCFRQFNAKNHLFFMVFLLLFLASCDSTNNVDVIQVNSQDRLSDIELVLQQNQPAKNTYYFGFDQRASPQEDVAQYLPFLKYLEGATGYQFKLHFTPKNSSTIEELGKNEIQFAAMGATGYLKAHELYGAISLVRGLNHTGKAEYQSMLIARPDSPIRNIKNLIGKRLAFGSRDSTQGHLIPRIMLHKKNIKLNLLGSYGYTGSHQLCAEAVVKGEYDVCGLQDQLAKSLTSQGLVKIIHSSSSYPSSGIVANKIVSANVLRTTKQALLAFKPKGIHSQNLYQWEKTEMPNGFITANESDYTELYKWSVKFNFLQEKTTRDSVK